jgi:hypothetical protein
LFLATTPSKLLAQFNLKKEVGKATNSTKPQGDELDERGKLVLQKFIDILLEPDFNIAAEKALQVIHKSDFNNSGEALKSDRLQFSFKKAWQNAKFYQNPIKITRVQKTNLSGIGFKDTAENGTSYKVWVGKKKGANGMPALIYVFFPAGGGEPKIHDYGSL